MIHNRVYSVGYEGKTIGAFLAELAENNVSLLVDVRRNALSRKKGFSKKQLAGFLESKGIGYLHFPELGIDSKKRKNLNSEKDYKELFKEYRNELPLKKHEIEKIEELAGKQRIALMCFEADKNFCHRSVLGDFLSQEVVHL